MNRTDYRESENITTTPPSLVILSVRINFISRSEAALNTITNIATSESSMNLPEQVSRNQSEHQFGSYFAYEDRE